MLFLVIETFKDGDPAPVYRRLSERGRMMPRGLTYLNSWVENGFSRCFQLMEGEDPDVLQQWTAQWDDLVDFEVVHVLTSEDARRRMEQSR